MTRSARVVGICVQGLALGTLLSLALVKLSALANTASVFRYEVF